MARFVPHLQTAAPVDVWACGADESKGPGLVAQLLALAAVRAPRLRRVVLENYDRKANKPASSLLLRELLDGLPMLSQIEQLHINGFPIPEEDSSRHYQGFAGLQSLQAFFHPSFFPSLNSSQRLVVLQSCHIAVG